MGTIVAKKYILIVYAALNTNKILEKLFDHMPDNGQYNSMKIKDMTFISFYSNDKIVKVKQSLMSIFKLPPLFFLFDISDKNRSKTFDMWFDTVEDKILLECPIDEYDEPKNLDINDIIELINKNGFDTLTPKQIKIIDDYCDS